jgi:two-component system sensor histidine kinase AtoS
MPDTILVAGVRDPVIGRIRLLAGKSGFRVETAVDREECRKALLNRKVLALIIHASLAAEDARIIEAMKSCSNSVQFIVYADDAEDGLSRLPPGDILGVLRGAQFDDSVLSGFLMCAARLNALEQKVESLNSALQENNSAASELNLKNKVLERERNFNDSIINSIAYGLMIVDADGTIILVNEMGKKIFGITAPKYDGLNYQAVVLEGIRENLAQNVREILQSGKAVEAEGFPVRDDLIISYSLSVIRDNGGSVIGLMFLGRDVTEWENLTHQLFQAEKLATMGTMLSGVAHELRNPVTIINARAQRLLQGAEHALTDKAKKAVESIENQSQRMGEIINNLLDFSRRNASGFGLADLNEILDAALNFLALEGRSDGVEIVKSYAEGCMTRCDRNQMEQVFLNLFTNACDAMRNRGKLFLATGNFDKYIRISIRDTGCGIPEENKKKIFDPFFTTKEAGRGTGLGLAIVCKIVQAHKGRLVMRSKVGQGTTFILMLPKGD